MVNKRQSRFDDQEPAPPPEKCHICGKCDYKFWMRTIQDMINSRQYKQYKNLADIKWWIKESEHVTRLQMDLIEKIYIGDIHARKEITSGSDTPSALLRPTKHT